MLHQRECYSKAFSKLRNEEMKYITNQTFYFNVSESLTWIRANMKQILKTQFQVFGMLSLFLGKVENKVKTRREDYQ